VSIFFAKPALGDDYSVLLYLDQYRLCPLSEYEELVKNNKTGAELEACFQKTPLEFVQENQAILSKSKSGEVIKTLVKGTFVNEGTSPEGAV
jgi:hypothetical protein